MKLTSLQFALVVGTLLLLTGTAYKMGQDSMPPMVMVQAAPTPAPAATSLEQGESESCPPPRKLEGRILGHTPEEAARIKSYRVNCKDTPEAEGCDVLLRYIATRDGLKRK